MHATLNESAHRIRLAEQESLPGPMKDETATQTESLYSLIRYKGNEGSTLRAG